MEEKQLKELKSNLIEELNNLENQSSENVQLVQEELEGIDNHLADSASELEMMTTELAIEDHTKDEIEKVKTALNKIEDGTYGHCIVCNEEISFERLKALPTALTCINHAENTL